MKVRLIRKQTIENFVRKHASSRSAFACWLLTVKAADWQTPEDIYCTFGSADLLGDGCSRVVFDIGGNNYRMICHYVFGETQVHLFICWIGTHAAYTALCRKGNQYVVSDY